MSIGLDVHLQSHRTISSFDTLLESAGLERIAAMTDSEVLIPRKGHTYHRGALVPANGGALPPHPNWKLVQYHDTGNAAFVPPARLIPWTGYAERVLGIPSTRGTTATSALHISIWRCELWTEGLFSCLFYTLGFLEAEAGRGTVSGLDTPPHRILVDWTSELILCHGGSARDNAWNHFFEQPDAPSAARQSDSRAVTHELSAADVAAAAAAGTLAVTSRFGPPWFAKLGRFRGAEPEEGAKAGGGGGRLDAATLAEGRAAFERWLVLRPTLRARVDACAAAAFGGRATRWLALHVRQTDKLKLDTPAYWQLTPSAVAEHAVATAAATNCDGVFVASDDATFKGAVCAALERTPPLEKRSLLQPPHALPL
jgi:hypothetical protein